jgi:hypothetical protein
MGLASRIVRKRNPVRTGDRLFVGEVGRHGFSGRGGHVHTAAFQALSFEQYESDHVRYLIRFNWNN